jgi:hypothetical protein
MLFSIDVFAERVVARMDAAAEIHLRRQSA